MTEIYEVCTLNSVLIIKFKNTNDLNKIMNFCAKQEIYDLAKVDYVTSNLDHIRDVLQLKASEEYKQMLTNYSAIMNTDLFKKEKTLVMYIRTESSIKRMII